MLPGLRQGNEKADARDIQAHACLKGQMWKGPRGALWQIVAVVGRLDGRSRRVGSCRNTSTSYSI